MDNVWYKAKVTKGNQHGREIGFPTINLTYDKGSSFKEGVYAALVCYKNQTFKAALYFGPRLVKDETRPVLEIYIMGFDKNIYTQEIKYKIIEFIRCKMKFESMEKLKKQIERDIKKINIILLNYEKRC